MVHAIVQESRLRWAQTEVWGESSFRTLYFGGGTPSLLSPSLFASLVKGIAEVCNLDMSSLEEVTLEANPEDITSERLEAWQNAGVTRLSVGIQTFHDSTLRWMNRAHSGKQAEDGVLLAHQSGFGSISIDLIYGVPTDRIWAEDMRRALDLPVQHLSGYALTVEPRTVLGTRVSRGEEPEPSDSRAVEEYHALCQTMQERGWLHYETSNWAKPIGSTGAFALAQHNSAYWSGQPYLGLGPGAHGFAGGCRYANIANNSKYLRAVNQGGFEQSEELLTNIDRYNEQLMTGLRTARGISAVELERSTGYRPDTADPRAWHEALQRGDLVEIEQGRYRVPENRWITGDRVAASLFLVS